MTCAHETVDALSGRCVYCRQRVDPPAALPGSSASRRCPTPGCARVVGHEEPCGPITVYSARPAEPSTADVFQELRDDIEGLGLHADLPRTAEAALRNLALLELRWQEMRSALQMVSEQGINSQWVENGRRRDMQREVRKALSSR